MFPIITHINDVLPHIEGRESFFVSDKGDYKVINYNSMIDAFGSMDDDGEAIRRECRGIKFYPDGYIMARPFHKFFNVGERPETSLDALPWDRPHLVMNKWDGSMIHAGIVKDQVRFMTKMGVTAVAEKAETLLTPDLVQFLRYEMMIGRTHIFEFISPANRIVVEYDRPRLVWTGCRSTESGEYLGLSDFKSDLDTLNILYEDIKFTRVGSIMGPNEFVQEIRKSDNKDEGVVVAWESGLRVKIKSEWYSLLHRQKDSLSSHKDALLLVLDSAIDDIIPLMGEKDRDRVKDMQRRVDGFIHNSTQMIAMFVNATTDLSQKDFALSDGLKAIAGVHPVLKAAAFNTRKQLLEDGLVDTRDHVEAVLRTLTTSNVKAKTLESAVGPLTVAGMFAE